MSGVRRLSCLMVLIAAQSLALPAWAGERGCDGPAGLPNFVDVIARRGSIVASISTARPGTDADLLSEKDARATQADADRSSEAVALAQETNRNRSADREAPAASSISTGTV